MAWPGPSLALMGCHRFASGFTPLKPKPLGSILDIERAKGLSPEHLVAAWDDYHLGRGHIGASMKAKLYHLLEQRSDSCRHFVIPLWKGSGYTTMFMQVQMPYMIFTGLEDYKARGTQASPYYTVTHYTEFAETKDTVLIRGDIVFTSKLTDSEAKTLLETAHSFYLNDTSKLASVRRLIMASALMLTLLLCASSWVVAAAAQNYSAIFNFGDSITDTGNLCTNGRPSQITFTQPPYGETYFGTPTCRCSDGRVVVDFLSTQFGLPFLPPSKSSSEDFKQGANMAITGATAMDAPFFRSLGLSDKIWNNGPISFQLQWFQQIATAVDCGQSCKSYLANSLFVFGEFGGNDYNAMIFGGYSIEQARKYTPKIVNTISRGIDKLIGMGATDIVVPGVLPIGCFPIYLTIYQSSNSSDYDDLGCLSSFNDLSTYHNTLLQKRVGIIQSRHRKTARIMYADFYSAVYDMVRNPQTYGFSSVFETCCGSGGGKYNYQNSARCGMSGASACANPAAHLSWDGIHLTEAAYKQIADGWLKGPYCRPPILHS
ncbi:unnamed protein product [Miscanthus lutarioriparius]|uniref:GDSL esterase/lipase n=1 Tax=Miscanthus lutarioriparius TaxID=422564 RepID=A0A811PXI2_9POAL|nr:unnamed protein product [Miscanthus lutarioriparius]